MLLGNLKNVLGNLKILKRARTPLAHLEIAQNPETAQPSRDGPSTDPCVSKFDSEFLTKVYLLI